MLRQRAVSGRLASGDPAPDVEVYAPGGVVVRTSELWGSRPVVLAFMRHFGCPFCREHLAELRSEHSRVTEAGATVAAVFMGPPSGAARFCSARDVPFLCLADPYHSAFDAFGLRAGSIRRWAGPRVGLQTLRMVGRGFGVGLPHAGQDVRRLGGTFVVDVGGVVRLAHYARDACDRPPPGAVLGSLGAS